MALQIKKGKQVRAQRVVIHGVEGVGKSSLASGLGRVLFIDAEDSTAHLDVARLEPRSMDEVRAAIALARKSEDYDAVAVDTVDWIEHQMLAEMLEEDSKASIADYGYGDGYTMLAERMMAFLKLLDGLIASGKHVILLAHSHVRRHEEPGDKGAYDRYELKLTKKGAPLVKEWADAVIFLNFFTKTVKTEDKKTRAVGGTERLIFTERCAAYDAKNRHGLPDKLEYKQAGKVPASLLAVFTGNTPPPAPAKADAVADPFLPNLVSGMEEAARAFLVERGMLKAGQGFEAVTNAHLMRIKSEPVRFLDGVKAKHAEMQPAEAAPSIDKGGEA
jgi:hypothetical protein